VVEGVTVAALTRGVHESWLGATAWMKKGVET
jgi:hypothetical protein